MVAASQKLSKEKENELTAIWGSHVVRESRVPKASKTRIETGEEDELLEMAERRAERVRQGVKGKGKGKNGEAEKKNAKRKSTQEYKIHCFVAPGTTRNEIRHLFEDYEPKVDLRVSQKGNLLNKTHYAVLTFANKAMALHAVLRFQGTDQMNTIGSRCVELGIMRSRRQNKDSKRRQKKVPKAR
jgi:hypothetical protein